MEKPNTFLGSWNDYPFQPDPLMTRERLAYLLRAWRRSSRQPTSQGTPIRNLARVPDSRGRAYRVTSSRYDETHTILICL